MTNPKVVVSLLARDQEYQVMQAADAERAAVRAGLDIEVSYARNNSILQVEQLYRFVHAPQTLRPAAIITQTVAGEGMAKVAREAVHAGIGWVLLNRDVPYIEPLRAENPRLPIAVVTTDPFAVGQIQGRQFRALLPSGGSVLYVHGPLDTSSAQQRLKGMEETIAGAKITVTSIAGEWTDASGERAVASWLRLSTSQASSLDLVSSASPG